MLEQLEYSVECRLRLGHRLVAVAVASGGVTLLRARRESLL
jgi:hypothetical protein